MHRGFCCVEHCFEFLEIRRVKMKSYRFPCWAISPMCRFRQLKTGSIFYALVSRKPLFSARTSGSAYSWLILVSGSTPMHERPNKTFAKHQKGNRDYLN